MPAKAAVLEQPELRSAWELFFDYFSSQNVLIFSVTFFMLQKELFSHSLGNISRTLASLNLSSKRSTTPLSSSVRITLPADWSTLFIHGYKYA